ncbi:MAG: hypothetical protein WBB28_01125 [Crinalium sp.]
MPSILDYGCDRTLAHIVKFDKLTHLLFNFVARLLQVGWKFRDDDKIITFSPPKKL